MMRRIALTVATVAVAVPVFASTGAFADAPNGTFTWNDNAKSNGNCVGVYSSRISQNGQFVGGNSGVIDQTTAPGSRSALVHAAQAESC